MKKISKTIIFAAACVFSNYGFNLAYSSGVFVSKKNIKLLDQEERSLRQEFLIVLSAFFEPKFIENLQQLYGYSITAENIDEILDTIFNSDSVIHFVAVNSKQAKNAMVFSTPLFYADKTGDDFMTQQEFKKWLKEKEYDFLVFTDKYFLSKKFDRGFSDFENNIVYLLSYEVSGIKSTIKARCQCEEPDLYIDDFSGYAEGFGNSVRTALENANKNCPQFDSGDGDVFSIAEKSIIKQYSCKFSIASVD